VLSLPALRWSDIRFSPREPADARPLFLVTGALPVSFMLGQSSAELLDLQAQAAQMSQHLLALGVGLGFLRGAFLVLLRPRQRLHGIDDDTDEYVQNRQAGNEDERD